MQATVNGITKPARLAALNGQTVTVQSVEHDIATVVWNGCAYQVMVYTLTAI